MAIKNDPNAPRGPGEDRFNRILRQKAPEKLEDGKHMVYEHALRCFCKLCGSLLNWDCPGDISYTETECCGLRYRLQPRTVIVHIEDVSSRPILPLMAGSNYSDPEFKFSQDLIVGDDAVIEETISEGLSEGQRSLRKPNPKEGLPEPKTYVIPAKKRKILPSKPPQVPKAPEQPRLCGICRKPGHSRKNCPGSQLPLKLDADQAL